LTHYASLRHLFHLDSHCCLTKHENNITPPSFESLTRLNHLPLPSSAATYISLLPRHHDQHTSVMSSVDFFGDFCLTCDCQTDGKSFCSQACRLAELDNYTNSEPSSPVYDEGPAFSQSSRRHESVSSGFSLPPAYNFAAHRSSSFSSLSTTATIGASVTKSSKITEQAKNDLRDYAGSFDHTRTLRRRVSMQSN
jgi:hypothetical protein